MSSRLTDEEILMDLQDVFHDVLTGQKDRHTCPACGKKNLVSEFEHGYVQLQCEDCNWKFEGHLR